MTASSSVSHDSARNTAVPSGSNGHGQAEVGGQADGQRTDQALGRVRWFSQEKGYGFIEPEDGGEDVFVRHGVIAADGFRFLEAGQQVRYAWTVDPRGPRATDVRVLG